jgi:hypothetical protein
MSVAALVLTVLAHLRKKARRDSETSSEGPEGPWPLYRRPVLSPIEQILCFRLVSALPTHAVLAQIQLSQLLGERRGLPRMTWINRINRLSASFVICSRGRHPQVVIDLDDSAHSSPERVQANQTKEHALRSAGLPIVRWDVQALSDATAIKTALVKRGQVSPGVEAAR